MSVDEAIAQVKSLAEINSHSPDKDEFCICQNCWKNIYQKNGNKITIWRGTFLTECGKRVDPKDEGGYDALRNKFDGVIEILP